MNKLELLGLRGKAKLGDDEALFELGQCYYFGIGVSSDFGEAYKYIKLAADKGMRDAEYFIEKNFVVSNNGFVSLTDEAKEVYDSASKLMAASEAGNPMAQWIRGYGKLNEESSDYMYNRGLLWVKKAVAQNFPPAQFSLGAEYFKDSRIKGKAEEGKSLIRQAAQRLWMPAIKFIAQHFSYQEAIPLLEKKVEEGEDAEAFGMLGLAYLKGNNVKQDVEKGMKLISQAAERGDKIAMYNLATIYETGEYGVEKDVQKAKLLFERCANEGDADAMTHLGRE